MGEALVRKGLGLVYGGARIGMMGSIADTVLGNGGDVIGVIPAGLVKKEVALTELADLRVVSTMHERKALMAELSDGFVAMPGGLGTVEEFVEVVTWAQLGIHSKPCGLLNTAGYFDWLLTFLGHSVDEQFVEDCHLRMIQTADDPDSLLRMFESYQPPVADKARWALGLADT
jgi:uncharacterized protein (TIGR00730 family)